MLDHQTAHTKRKKKSAYQRRWRASKKAPLGPLTDMERLVLDHLRKWKGQVIPYHELWSIGIPFTSGHCNLANFVAGIRSKLPDVEISCVSGKGYIYRGGGEETAPKQKKMFTPARPATGAYCRICGKELHSYDVQRGECFTHPVNRVRLARETVPVFASDDRTRERTRENARRKTAAQGATD